MGFCYNRQNRRGFENFPQTAKKEGSARKRLIPKVYAKQLAHHALSVRDLKFLKSIGLKIRNNGARNK